MVDLLPNRLARVCHSYKLTKKKIVVRHADKTVMRLRVACMGNYFGKCGVYTAAVQTISFPFMQHGIF